MDILSPETLTLLRDENVRKAVEEILQRTIESKTVTVAAVKGERGATEEKSAPTQVKVRRVA
jgi:hypothetical protein